MTASSGGRSTPQTRPLTGKLLLCGAEERAEVPLKIEQDQVKSQFTPQELDELHTLLVKFEAAFFKE